MSPLAFPHRRLRTRTAITLGIGLFLFYLVTAQGPSGSLQSSRQALNQKLGGPTLLGFLHDHDKPKQVNFEALNDLIYFAGEEKAAHGGALDTAASAATTKPVKIELPPHTYLENGLLIPNPEGQHPVYDLIKRSRAEWERKLETASRTLQDAVDEYQRRYGRAPPAGFDRWWRWARKNNVRLPDEYDQIHKDLEPFWAIGPSELRQLLQAGSDKSGMFTIKCTKGDGAEDGCSYTLQVKGLNQEGSNIGHMRAKDQLDLIAEIQHELEDVEAVFYSHDVPWQFLGNDYRSALVDSAQEGEYFNDDEHELDRSGGRGWESGCSPSKPLRKNYPDRPENLDELWGANERSFVWDHQATMDPCTHPNLVHLIGYLSGHNKGPVISHELLPTMAMSKTMFHSDILSVNSEGWTDDSGNDPAWEDKTEEAMMWRGRTTGILFKDANPWNISQRINLVEHAARQDGSIPVLRSAKLGKPVGEPVEQEYSKLNERYMDIAFVDHAIQCDPNVCETLQDEYHFAGRLDWNQANKYKYMIDLDGNGWSARFKRLMNTNSLILKSTIFPEWYSDRIQPWVHYVPLKADLTDMYDIMTFFRGSDEPGADGQPQPAHDGLARQIAIAGKHWSHNYWRKQDMASYQFRLLLELARLMAPNRSKASYESPRA